MKKKDASAAKVSNGSEILLGRHTLFEQLRSVCQSHNLEVFSKMKKQIYKAIKLATIKTHLSKIKTDKILDEDEAFEQFHEVMGLVWVETGGSKAGRKVLNQWAKGEKNLPTGKALKSLWEMYNDESQRYFGMARLETLAEGSGKTNHFPKAASSISGASLFPPHLTKH